MAKYQKITVDIIDALAVAIHIYREHGNKVTKFDEGKPGNKEVIYDYFARGSGLIHKDPELIELAKNLRQSIGHRITFNTLIGLKNNDFLVVVDSLVKKDIISSQDFGLLVWSPKLVDDFIKADSLKEHVSLLGVNSQHIGIKGNKVEITFNEIVTKFSEQFRSYRHSGIDEGGNLINFWNRNQIPNGSKIAARVKEHVLDNKFNNAKMTKLNYVKVVNNARS